MSDAAQDPKSTPVNSAMEGGCTCGHVRYRLERAPMFVHCCHCTWCQRETGSAFAINALIETSCVVRTSGATEAVDTPTESGAGQEIHRCVKCRVALWSHYSAAGRAVAFVRVGSLDAPDSCPPDIHIFTSSRQSWVTLDERVPVMAEYYRRSEHWPADSVARYKRALGS
jgi:hypothetical protein